MRSDPIPIGTYRLRLVEAEHRDSPRTGRWFIYCVFEVVDPPYVGTRIKYAVAVRDETLWMLEQLALALDVHTPMELVRKLHTLVGHEVYGRVRTRVFRDFPPHNVIEKVV